MSSDRAEGIRVGRVLRPWGRRGEMVIEPHTHDVTRFQRLMGIQFCLAGRAWTLRLRCARCDRAGRPILGFHGIDDISGAEDVRGAELLIPETEMERPSGNAYLNHELLGLRVRSVDGNVLGRVRGLIETDASATVFVVRDEKDHEILIPAVREMIDVVDVAAGLVVVRLPAGLSELNDPDPEVDLAV